MDYFNAFWTGGLICALVQILLDKTKLLPGRVMVLLVCQWCPFKFSRVLSAICRFCRRRRHGSAARIRTYFMERYAKAISEDGFLGLFTGGFTACALGVSAALIFSYLSSMIFRPQMKE